MTYTELPSDAAFTLFLALLKPKQVLRESHSRLNTTERRMVAYSRRQNPVQAKRLPSVKKTSLLGSQGVPAVRQMFSNKQIQIAMAVLAKQENQTKAS